MCETEYLEYENESVLAFKGLSRDLSQVHVDSIAHLDKNVIAVVRELSADYEHNITMFRRKIDSHYSSIREGRNKVLKAFDHHLQALSKAQTTGDFDAVDPWLTEKLVDNELDAVNNIENGSHTSIASLHNLIRDYEVKLIQCAQKIVPLFSASVSNHESQLQNNLRRIINFNNLLDPQQGFNEFLLKHSSKMSSVESMREFASQWNFERTEADKNVIVKCDVLFRQGTLRKSTFKPALFAITKYGFLHCFTNEVVHVKSIDEIARDMSMLRYSVNLRLPKLDAIKSINCIEIAVPASGRLFSSKQKFIIKLHSEQEVDEWLDEIGKFLLKNRQPPTLDIESELNESIGEVSQEMAKTVIQKETPTETVADS